MVQGQFERKTAENPETLLDVKRNRATATAPRNGDPQLIHVSLAASLP
jgi:hypothetical protein